MHIGRQRLPKQLSVALLLYRLSQGDRTARDCSTRFGNYHNCCNSLYIYIFNNYNQKKYIKNNIYNIICIL